jgi:protein-S-isoprenylcysteine O-methyltransferase Ste14
MQTLKKVRPWIDFVEYPLIVGLAVWFSPRVALWYAGLCFSFVSALFWGLARLQLGESFSVDPEARKLVTRGLYSNIRHPVYLFGDLAYLGAFLALQFWPALLVWLWMAIVDFRRAQREERVLAEAFGPEYLAYRSRTWF